MVLPQLEASFIESLIGEPIENFSLKSGSAKGDNIAGDICSIQIQPSSSPSKLIHLIYKTLPSKDLMLKEWAMENRIFGLEIDMYTTIARKIEELVKKHGNVEYQLPIPKYYGGLCNGSDEDYLVLGDERVAGFVMSNKYADYTLPQIQLILRELAKFHAYTYFLIKYEGEQQFSASPSMERYANGFWNGTNPKHVEESQDLYEKTLDIALNLLADKEVAKKIRTNIKRDELGVIVRQTANMTDVKIFPVMVHGDFWANNILLKYDADKNPIATKFIDFQQARRGNIYEDLLYFIFTSTSASFRKNHLFEILSDYFDEFNVVITKSVRNCPNPIGFTKGRFFDLFYDCYRPIYIYMSFAIPLQLGTHTTDMDEVQEPVGDNDPFGMNVKDLYLSNPAPMTRFEEMTSEFVQLGIF